MDILNPAIAKSGMITPMRGRDLPWRRLKKAIKRSTTVASRVYTAKNSQQDLEGEFIPLKKPKYVVAPADNVLGHRIIRPYTRGRRRRGHATT